MRGGLKTCLLFGANKTEDDEDVETGNNQRINICHVVS